MRHNTKKSISFLLASAMMLSLIGCSKSDPEVKELTTEQMKRDVQEYTAAFIDPSAEIGSFYSSQDAVSDTEVNVKCQAAWDGSIGSGTEEFSLTYKFSDGSWELTNCTAASSNNSGTVQAKAQTGTADSSDLTPQADYSVSDVLTGYSVTEVGTFEDVVNGDVASVEGKLVVINDDKTQSMLSTDGSMNNSKKYASVKELKEERSDSQLPYYYIVVDGNIANENCMGIVNAEGKEIMPCEAANIRMVDGSERFVDVYYSTGETTSDSKESITKVEGTDSKTHYYKGYRKVFDLKTEAFVGDIETTARYSNSIKGNMTNFAIEFEHETTIYNSDGDALNNGLLVNFGKDFYTLYDYDTRKNYVYNGDGEIIYSTGERISPISTDSEYLKVESDDGTVHVINKDGSPVINSSFKKLSGEKKGFFRGQSSDETKYMLVNMNDEIVCESEEPIFDTYVDGYFYTDDTATGKDILIYPNGAIVGDMGLGFISMTCYDDNKNYFVINTGTYSLNLPSASRMAYGMVCSKEAPDKYNAYDLFTGNKLLPADYSEVIYSAGYIYALDGSTWHIFKVDKIRS